MQYSQSISGTMYYMYLPFFVFLMIIIIYGWMCVVRIYNIHVII